MLNHEDRAKAKLLMQYREKPRFEAVVSAIAAEVQELEDALHTLNTGRALPTAVGAQLDVLGRIVGQGRLNLSDTQFRRYISARIALNNSSGTIPEVRAIFASLAAIGSAVEVHERFPAAFVLRLYVEGLGAGHPGVMLDFLHAARPAGVSAVLEFQTHSDAETFDWFENAGGSGWADEATGLLGGYWADAIDSAG